MMAGTLAILIASILSSPAWVCQAQTTRQSSAGALERGTVDDRFAALEEILKVPPEQRVPAEWRAIVHEATRMLEYRRSGQIPDSEDERETNNHYWATLALALGQSHDAAVIPLLVAYAAHSGPAAEAVVRFGDAAVPALLQVANGDRDELEQRGGATLALAEMLRGPMPKATALSDASRRKIGSLAEHLLTDKFTPENVLGIAMLALATGRPDLRQKLEEFATNRAIWTRRGPVDEGSITNGQRMILRELEKAKHP